MDFTEYLFTDYLIRRLLELNDYIDSINQEQEMAELKYKDITEKILGASFEVHKFLGNGFQEFIYQRALSWELKEKGLDFADFIFKNKRYLLIFCLFKTIMILNALC